MASSLQNLGLHIQQRFWFYLSENQLIMWINVNISKERLDFLNLVIHEDAAQNISGAVNWCIDACQRIEKRYGVDACYVGWNDIRLAENDLPTGITSMATIKEEAIRLCKLGLTLNALKYVKDNTGWGLRESKDWVDKIRTDLQ